MVLVMFQICFNFPLDIGIGLVGGKIGVTEMILARRIGRH